MCHDFTTLPNRGSSPGIPQCRGLCPCTMDLKKIGNRLGNYRDEAGSRFYPLFVLLLTAKLVSAPDHLRQTFKTFNHSPAVMAQFRAAVTISKPRRRSHGRPNLQCTSGFRGRIATRVVPFRCSPTVWDARCITRAFVHSATEAGSEQRDDRKAAPSTAKNWPHPLPVSRCANACPPRPGSRLSGERAAPGNPLAESLPPLAPGLLPRTKSFHVDWLRGRTRSSLHR